MIFWLIVFIILIVVMNVLKKSYKCWVLLFIVFFYKIEIVMIVNICIVLLKGCILDEILLLLKKVGIEFLEEFFKSCKLIFFISYFNVEIIIICVMDVFIFVEYGVVDVGVVGKDVLMEYGVRGVYELFDFDIFCCKLMVVVKF